MRSESDKRGSIHSNALVWLPATSAEWLKRNRDNDGVACFGQRVEKSLIAFGPQLVLLSNPLGIDDQTNTATAETA